MAEHARVVSALWDSLFGELSGECSFQGPEVSIPTAPERELSLANPMGEFDSGQGNGRAAERLEGSHRSASTFDRSMILLNEIVTARDPIYRRRVFNAEIIELCVRWYITYRLSFRDLVAMMAERGVTVAHSTILRWVSRYVPEYQKALEPIISARRYFLAHRRDVHFHSRQMALPLSSRRQAGKDGRLSPSP
jgi:hypothetical protein